ncbi:asparagine synthase-related protein [Streptomyces huiliensis]|uniref:asparagine synthase-related protein n=1 Tax=Streptomyces huiliensis TaxID=2876027 RepID=UPI001CBF9E25|nr:asparagine synthase-related protein [Streptomyces huiliensis]MBZ4319451.1 asparagine synthase C-terminal domain-containing protein [Streptomyces huiliensis]
MPGTLSVHSGPWGTGPVFAVARGEEVHAHWDPSRLYALLDDDCLDWLRAAAFLAWFETPYSRRTLFRDMWLLSAGSCATWPVGDGAAEALRGSYPPPVPLPHVGRLVPGGDVPGAYWDALTASMRRWLGVGGAADGDRAAAELSGGLDSGLVTAAAASLVDRPLRTYGLVMPDAGRTEQRARRAELIRRYALVDTSRPLGADPPLAPMSERALARGVVPWEECYHEALGALRATAAADGIRLLSPASAATSCASRTPRTAPSVWTTMSPRHRRRPRSVSRDISPTPPPAHWAMWWRTRRPRSTWLRTGTWRRPRCRPPQSARPSTSAAASGPSTRCAHAVSPYDTYLTSGARRPTRHRPAEQR